MPGSTAARRYGNQGGGWLPEQAPAPVDETTAYDQAQCQACGRWFRHRQKSPPRWCGLKSCDHHLWTPEQWEGRAAMAVARLADWRLWLTLDDIDIDALARAAGADPDEPEPEDHPHDP